MNSYIKQIIVSILVFAAFIAIAIWGDRLRFAFGVFAYSLLGWRLSHTQNSKILRSLIFSIPLILLLAYIFLKLPSTVFAIPSVVASLLAFYVLMVVGRYKNVVIAGFTLFLLLIVFYYFAGNARYRNWVTYNEYKFSYEPKRIRPFEIIKPTDTLNIGLSENDDTYYVLDIWHTKCGPCFDNFPVLAKTIRSFSGYSNLQIIALDLPFRNEDIHFIRKVLEHFKINPDDINPGVLMNNSVLETDAGITVVPTVIIIKGNLMLFKGNLENAKKFLISKGFRAA